MADLIDFCPQYRPGKGGNCIDCGRTFEEHCAQFGLRVKKVGDMVIRIEDNEAIHKPWCDCIAKLGDQKCNCLQAGQKEILMKGGHIRPKECLKWRRTSGENCICGLPWYMHTMDARNGYTMLVDFKPAVPAMTPTMSNEEAAHWVVSMGKDNAERLSTVQNLLRNAYKDNMSHEDRIFLEQVEKILLQAHPETAKRGGHSKHPCTTCGQKKNDLAGRMCQDCVELAVDEADAIDLKDTAKIVEIEDNPERFANFD